MLSEMIFNSRAMKTKRVCVFIIALTVLGFALYYLISSADATEDQPSELFLKWFTIDPQIERPRFFSRQDAYREIPNLPIAYLNPNFRRVKYRMNETCAPYPDVFQLSFHNLYWQSFSLSKSKWYLFAAYYESRILSDVKPAIRIVVAIDRFDKDMKPFCQIWFPGLKQPVIVEINQPEVVWLSNTRNLTEYADRTADAFLITCPIPATHASLVPESVSVVEKECHTARNHLEVIYNKADEKQDFAVCTTALNFVGMDLSVRIAEWIEMVHLLGADQIFFYYLHHHDNVSKLLKYYEEEGKILLSQFSLPGEQPNLPLLQNLYLTGTGEYLTPQYIALQDCLYRNMYSYNYIVVMDIDEIIMPILHSNWKDLIDSIPSYYKNHVASFCVKNFWFYDDDTYPNQTYPDVPDYLHMLRHVHRTMKSFTWKKSYIHAKCFHVTEKLKMQGLHHTRESFSGDRTSYVFPEIKARLQHYCDQHLSRNRCINKTDLSIFDGNIWRYKTTVIERLLPTLNKLGFINS